MARGSLYGAYVRGRLALAGLDLRTPVSAWCDAVYAILAEAPHEVLERLRDRMVVFAKHTQPRGIRANNFMIKALRDGRG